MAPRDVKLTPLRQNMHLFGDYVPMPPKDDRWTDAHNIYMSQHGYPQTSLNAVPEYVPENAPRFVPERHGNMSEAFSALRLSFDNPILVALTVFMLLLNLILLLVLLLRL